MAALRNLCVTAARALSTGNLPILFLTIFYFCFKRSCVIELYFFSVTLQMQMPFMQLHEIT